MKKRISALLTHKTKNLRVLDVPSKSHILRRVLRNFNDTGILQQQDAVFLSIQPPVNTPLFVNDNSIRRDFFEKPPADNILWLYGACHWNICPRRFANLADS